MKFVGGTRKRGGQTHNGSSGASEEGEKHVSGYTSAFLSIFDPYRINLFGYCQARFCSSPAVHWMPR